MSYQRYSSFAKDKSKAFQPQNYYICGQVKENFFFTMSAQSISTQYKNMKSAPGSDRPSRTRTPSAKGLESIAMAASQVGKRKKSKTGPESGTDATAPKQPKRRSVAVVPRATAPPSTSDDDAVQTLLEIRGPGRRQAGDSS